LWGCRLATAAISSIRVKLVVTKTKVSHSNNRIVGKLGNPGYHGDICKQMHLGLQSESLCQILSATGCVNAFQETPPWSTVRFCPNPTRRDQPWSTPSLLYSGYLVSFLGVNVPGVALTTHPI